MGVIKWMCVLKVCKQTVSRWAKLILYCTRYVEQWTCHAMHHYAPGSQCLSPYMHCVTKSALTLKLIQPVTLGRKPDVMTPCSQWFSINRSLTANLFGTRAYSSTAGDSRVSMFTFCQMGHISKIKTSSQKASKQGRNPQGIFCERYEDATRQIDVRHVPDLGPNVIRSLVS